MTVKNCKVRKLVIGEKVGLLTVIHYCYTIKRRSHWKCSCECGNEIIISRKHLLERNLPDCGCVPRINKGWAGRSEQEQNDFKWNCIKNKSHWEGSCLIWDGYLQKGVTPSMSCPKGRTTVRKWIWEFYNGKSESRNKIASCENARCINIKHIGLK